MKKSYRIKSDIATDDWVAKYVPRRIQPYVRLTRMERKFDIWALILPSAWGCMLAHADVKTWILMMIGSFLMSGIGCTWNDIIDRDIDAKMTRTKSRPIPAGVITPEKAFIFFGLQLGLAFIVWLFLTPYAKIVSLACLPILWIYPFAKRFFIMPHLILGMITNFGTILAYADTHGTIALPALLLYAGSIFWTAGFDATYAIQDIKDDKKNDIKSMPRLLGKKIKIYLYAVYGLLLVLTMTGAGLGGMNRLFFILYPLAWLAFPIEVYKMKRNAEGGFNGFHDNRLIGFALTAAFIAGFC